MKKILLSVFTICLALGAFAQTPCNFTAGTTHTSPGVYPTGGLPDATIGVPYSTMIEVVLPKDTVVNGTAAKVCYIQVDSVKYLADGLSFTCGEDTPGLLDMTVVGGCKWKVIHTGGIVNRGCVIITGTPTSHTKIATDSLQVWVNAGGGTYIPAVNQCITVTSLNAPYSVHHYVGGYGVGIENATAKNLNLSLFPNPTNANSTLRFTLTEKANVNVAVYDLMGKNVLDVFAGNEAAGEHSYLVNAEKLSSGIYMLKVTLDNGASVVTNRIVVE